MRTQLALAFVLTAVPITAAAHLGLDSPVSRYGPNVLKQPPCGMTGGQRSRNVTTYRAGETITVTWNEYIDHPGHYRIAFDADGDDDFVDPICLSGCNSRNPVVEMNSNDAVLLDGIADNAGGNYAVMVTLPNVACTNCTLQVIQVMYDKPPYTIPGNEMYYQCADLILIQDPPPDAGQAILDASNTDSSVQADAGVRADAATVRSDAGAGDDQDDGGCTAAGARGGRPPLLSVLFALLALSVRRPGSRAESVGAEEPTRDGKHGSAA